MTLTIAPTDTLADSQRLLAALDQLRAELPIAEELLAVHRPLHLNLIHTSELSEQVVLAWRMALAQRWEHEVAGRRLYKRALRRLIQHYGDAAPEVQLLSRGGAEAESSPSELLADLRRLDSAITLGPQGVVPPELRAELAATCAALERAIRMTSGYETQRRHAVLDQRMANEAYRRARSETQRRLRAQYAGRLQGQLGELFAE